MLEHGAYTLLLDRYYVTEQGIPKEHIYRVAHARTPAEKKAVDRVLREFFYLAEDGLWKKSRCESELESIRSRIAAARENGKLGGRPKSQQNQRSDKPTGFNSDNPSETPGFPAGSENETQPKALQSPDSNLQSPGKSKNPLTPLEGGQIAQSRSGQRKPREIRASSSETWERCLKVIDKILGTPLTWDDAKRLINDPAAHETILAIGGYKAVADRTEFTQGELKRRFREHYETELEKGREKEGPNGHEHDEQPPQSSVNGLMSEAAKALPQ
jgi:uncharacterized protein YdaU (DUF1376 family)